MFPTLWGIPLTKKFVVRVLFGLTVGALVLFTLTQVRGHFQKFNELKKVNQSLNSEVLTLTQQKQQLVQLNEHNATIYRESLRQAQAASSIAAAERVASESRSTSYREIRNEIQSAPEPRQSVSPVILRTTDRLWAGSTGEDQ